MEMHKPRAVGISQIKRRHYISEGEVGETEEAEGEELEKWLGNFACSSMMAIAVFSNWKEIEGFCYFAHQKLVDNAPDLFILSLVDAEVQQH